MAWAAINISGNIMLVMNEEETEVLKLRLSGADLSMEKKVLLHRIEKALSEVV
jgi:hypothetical protein